MRVGYNEIDPYCCAWLENLMRAGLIPIGKIFCRDLRDIRPDEVAEFDQFHWFAGLGGWVRALEFAEWSGPCWTGSCPCQPFSAAGKGLGFADERHLWPYWQWHIEQRRPAIIFGEQVARATDWLALVHGDLETMGYAVGCLPIEAASVGARHKRDRYWFVADAIGSRGSQGELAASSTRSRRAVGAESCVVASADVEYAQRRRDEWTRGGSELTNGRANVADADRESSVGPAVSWPERDPWLVEPDVGRVVARLPEHVDQLRALGNSIVPQCAATFVRAFMEARRGGYV